MFLREEFSGTVYAELKQLAQHLATNETGEKKRPDQILGSDPKESNRFSWYIYRNLVSFTRVESETRFQLGRKERR